jgi:hypothetical protein
MPIDKEGNYYEPGYKRDYEPANPLMPSGQPYPSAPADPSANPGAAPRIPNNDGWGKDQK